MFKRNIRFPIEKEAHQFKEKEKKWLTLLVNVN